MPIGSAKIGVLGAGLVPGGTQTFNASGTFTVPPGVKKVNITGKGGTGNPGNAGNSGNAGNPGTGGAGGGTGAGQRNFPCGNQFRCGSLGGGAFKTCYSGTFQVAGLPVPSYPPFYALGGTQGSGPNQSPGNPGSSGASGNAGNAGNAGNPGNPGNASSGLSQTFNGGAGGNAGVAGAAGNAGSSGGGGAGSSAGPSNGGSGGSGAGNGGNGYGGGRPPAATCSARSKGGSGGGGAGVTNDGSSGPNGTFFPPTDPLNNFVGAAGGTWSCSSAPIVPGYFPTNTTGGMGPGTNTNGPQNSLTTAQGGPSINVITFCVPPPIGPPFPGCRRPGPFSFNPYGGNPAPGNPNFPQIYRSGGGGGSGTFFTCNPYSWSSWSLSGGAGGGGRGGAGGAGGTSPTPSGSAATPSTVNCVSVTPGSSYPITVASPGGQIVISWNPQ